MRPPLKESKLLLLHVTGRSVCSALRPISEQESTRESEHTEMLRSAASKVMWVGRATVFLVGLAVILALLFGVTSMAFARDGQSFILGKRNVAQSLSTLVKRGAGPALSLQVGSGAPLKVNSDKRVANLNADEVDGKEAPLVASISSLGFPQNSPDVDVATTSSTKLRTGVYVVPFKRDVRQCKRVVSLGPGPFNFLNPAATSPGGGEASTANVTNVPDANKKIMVATRNSSGTLTDQSFHLAVFC
jgi:hypothetical protein